MHVRVSRQHHRATVPSTTNTPQAGPSPRQPVTGLRPRTTDTDPDPDPDADCAPQCGRLRIGYRTVRAAVHSRSSMAYW